MNSCVSIGEKLVFENEPHFASEIDAQGNVIFKTFKELYEESSCKGCKFIFRGKGWLYRERVGIGEKMPNVVGCRLGQFVATHNPVFLKKQCLLKNYYYNERQQVKELIEKMLKDKVGDFYTIIKPTLFGFDVIDVKGFGIRHIVISDSK